MKTSTVFQLALASYGLAQNTTSYACNPAHSYPGGVTCIETGGSLSLVYPTATANYTTEVVTAYTTYCPYPTTVVPGNGKTYTVTSATTLTITDCPCTVKKPYTSSTPVPTVPANTTVPVPTHPANSTTSVVTAITTYCPTPTTLTIGKSLTYTVSTATTITATCHGGCTLTVPVSSAPPAPSVPAGNHTVPGVPSGTGMVPSATVPVFEGAGSKIVASSALLGLICAFAAML